MDDELRVNRLIEIEVNFNGFNEYLSSRIEEVNADSMLISAPFYRGKSVPLRRNQEIKVCFAGETCAFGFFAKIIDKLTQPILMLQIEKPTNLIRIQRREYVRVPASVNINFTSKKEDYTYRGTTVDVSGGGLLFTTRANLRPDEQIDIYVNLPEKRPILCRSTVIRSIPLKDSSLKKVAVRFDNINEQQREQIIHYVFEQQRKLIQKNVSIAAR